MTMDVALVEGEDPLPMPHCPVPPFSQLAIKADLLRRSKSLATKQGVETVKGCAPPPCEQRRQPGGSRRHRNCELSRNSRPWADRRPRFWASTEFLHQALTFSEHQLAGSPLPLGINTNIQYLQLTQNCSIAFNFL